METHARTSNSNSKALVVVTETCRSLKEKDGFTLSFLMYRWSRPSILPRFLALKQRGQAGAYVYGLFCLHRQEVMVAPHREGGPSRCAFW